MILVQSQKIKKMTLGPNIDEEKNELEKEVGANETISKDENQKQNIQTTDLEKQETCDELYTAFTTRERLFIVVMTSLAAFFSPLSGQIYFPAVPTIADYYHTSIGKINLTITTYMIFQGIAPTFYGSVGDSIGRRPAYIIAFTIYLIANIGLATQTSYAALMVLRGLQSCGSSGTIALGYGVISDISTPAQRGRYLGPVAAGIMLAPAFGPTIGGLLAEFLGWRSIFWFLTIVSAVYLFFYILFVPETLRTVVGNGSIRPQSWWVMSPYQYWKIRRLAKTAQGIPTTDIAQKPQFVLPNPFKTLAVLREKDALLIILFLALASAGTMTMLASLPYLLQTAYGFNSLKIGLCYIPVGISAAFAAVLNGKLMDYNYQRWAKKLGIKVDRKKKFDLRYFPIEKARLEPVFFMIPIIVIFIIGLGWTLQARANLAVVLVILFVSGFCLVSTSNTLSSLLVDLFPKTPAAASAANNLVRATTAGAMTAAINPMLHAMGWGWCFTFLGTIMLLGLSLLWCVTKWGMIWREERYIRIEKQKARKQNEKEVSESSKTTLEPNIVPTKGQTTREK
jgi:multidrug resistance protein